MADVFFDGRLIGTVDKPKDFVNSVRNARRGGKLDSQINVNYDR